MNRLNLTLDDDTWEALARHARRLGTARAAVARDLIHEALEMRDRSERRKKLAADYAAQAGDLPDLLDAEAGQLDLLDDGED